MTYLFHILGKIIGSSKKGDNKMEPEQQLDPNWLIKTPRAEEIMFLMYQLLMDKWPYSSDEGKPYINIRLKTEAKPRLNIGLVKTYVDDYPVSATYQYQRREYEAVQDSKKRLLAIYHPAIGLMPSTYSVLGYLDKPSNKLMLMSDEPLSGKLAVNKLAKFLEGLGITQEITVINNYDKLPEKQKGKFPTGDFGKLRYTINQGIEVVI